MLDANFGEEQFLLYDSGEEESRILIFGTDDNLAVLGRYEKWQCDGTCKVVPMLTAQLYTIHVGYLNYYVPVLYALLPDKTEITYERFFNAVKRLCPAVQPHSVLTDFETAAINASHTVFQTPTVVSCFFHLSQNIAKRMQSEGLKRYENEVAFALMVRTIPALVFVPPDRVVETYEALMPNEMLPLLDYFERTYILGEESATNVGSRCLRSC